MHLKRLQSFVKIVEKRSFTEAAAALGQTTSALSKQIKALEDELQASLFHRGGGVEPTAVGRLVYERGRAILADWDALAAECRARAASPSGKLRIGASTVPASYLLPAVVKRLLERYPDVELSVFEDDSDAVLARLEQRSVDIALVGNSPSSAALRFEEIAEDRLVVVSGAEAAPAFGPVRGTDDWLRLPFILREEGSGTRRALAEALGRLGVSLRDLKVAAVSSSTESAMALVEAGAGITAVSHWALSLPRKVSVVAELPTDRRFYAAYEAGRSEDPLIRLFLDAAAAIYG